MRAEAHGINQQQILNFDSRTGLLLTLKDIFVSGYEQPLKDLLLKALLSKTGCKNIHALRARGYLSSMDIFPTENFILGSETITFIYNPSEIAPYSMGATQLVIPYSDLDKLIKNTIDL